MTFDSTVNKVELGPQNSKWKHFLKFNISFIDLISKNHMDAFFIYFWEIWLSTDYFKLTAKWIYKSHSEISMILKIRIDYIMEAFDKRKIHLKFRYRIFSFLWYLEETFFIIFSLLRLAAV